MTQPTVKDARELALAFGKLADGQQSGIVMTAAIGLLVGIGSMLPYDRRQPLVNAMLKAAVDIGSAPDPSKPT